MKRSFGALEWPRWTRWGHRWQFRMMARFHAFIIPLDFFRREPPGFRLEIACRFLRPLPAHP